MSLEAYAWAWRQPVRGTRKLVLLALADFADRQGVCWPSVATLGEYASVGRSSVQEALRGLEGDGFVERVTRRVADRNGGNDTNLYKLVMGAGTPGGPVAPGEGLPGTPGEGGPELPSTPARPAGHEPSTEPSVEPSSEPSSSMSPIEEVWSEYVSVMGPRQKKLGAEEWRIIRDALKVASVDECKTAIRGNAASDFHQGRHPDSKGKKYNRLTQILKGRGGKVPRTTRETIDFFIELAEGAAPAASSQLRSPRAEDLKRVVRLAHQWADDADLAKRRDAAVAELTSMGIEVYANERNGGPAFREKRS